jgi:hypothetical protein
MMSVKPSLNYFGSRCQEVPHANGDLGFFPPIPIASQPGLAFLLQSCILSKLHELLRFFVPLSSSLLIPERLIYCAWSSAMQERNLNVHIRELEHSHLEHLGGIMWQLLFLSLRPQSIKSSKMFSRQRYSGTLASSDLVAFLSPFSVNFGEVFPSPRFRI